MEYICIFTFLFLGITGAVSFSASLWGLFTNASPPKTTVVRAQSCDEIECKVRSALHENKGSVLILIPDDLSDKKECMLIARKLCKENPRVGIKKHIRYKMNKSSERSGRLGL